MKIQSTFLAVTITICSVGAQAQQVINQTPEVVALRSIKDQNQLHTTLAELGASGQEKDYNTLYTYYQLTNRHLADSVGRIAIDKFPKGTVALNVASRKMIGKDIVQQEKALAELKSEFPNQNLDKFYAYIVRSFLEEKNAPSAFKYLDLMSEQARSNAIDMTISMASLFDAKTTSVYLASELNKRSLSEKSRMSLLLSQSNVLSELGDYQKAFESIQTYYNQTSKRTPYIEASYYLMMSKIGRYSEALPHLEAAVLARIGGDPMKKELRTAYQRVNREKDVEAYFASLENKMNEGMLHEVEKLMIKEKSPFFTVLDADGKTVSLSDFRNKTVVIDFWATWCGPCKRALPGMQATVNKYKDDSSVAFLFIHTWEAKGKEANATVAAKKYFADNNYENLPIYMDLQNASKVNPAVSAFKVKGIPAKFVIDKNGDIRFKMEGASTDVDFAVAELSSMIELSKKVVGK
ncbi:TlpA family protein disulfide reductase [Pedobacter sp. GR22-6]|uniref:TlpA family protein disulfide reductase n=1 Tax=Pedobacter sp. GR22-6 TaxID=3127957 RepID=UPI00307F359C